MSQIFLYALTTLTVTINTDNDPGGTGQVGDLRYCLNSMNQNLNIIPDDYAIIFATTMTIQLNGILPIINNSSNPVNITIGNPSIASMVTIDGNNGTYSGFFIPVGNVLIQNMAFQNLTAKGGNGGDGISGGGGGMGAGGAIYAPQTFLNGSNPSITLMNISISNCSAIGGNGGNYFNLSSTGNEGGGGGGGFSGNGSSITTTGSTGGAGGGGFGGNGGDVTLAFDVLGGGGGGLGSRATIGVLTNLGNGGSDQGVGLNGNGYGLTITAGSGGGGYTGGTNAGGGGGGAGTGAYDLDYTVKAGNSGLGGGGGGPSNGPIASGGIDIGNLGGGSGGTGANTYGSGFGGGGGGGSGLGAAIFVDTGLNLTIQAFTGSPTTFNTTNNTTQAGIHGTGGTGGSDGTDGMALGNSIFLRTGSSLTFTAQDVNDVLTLGEHVAFIDDTSLGAGGTSVFVNGNGAATLAGTLEINLDSTVQPGRYTLLTSAGITGTFDTITFKGTTPKYTISYLPLGAPTYVQLELLNKPPATTVNIPATVNGSPIINPAVVCCGRPILLGPLPTAGSGSTVYTVVNKTGSVTCQIGQTNSQTYLKMYGTNGSCTIIGTKDGIVSNPLTVITA